MTEEAIRRAADSAQDRGAALAAPCASHSGPMVAPCRGLSPAQYVAKHQRQAGRSPPCHVWRVHAGGSRTGATSAHEAARSFAGPALRPAAGWISSRWCAPASSFQPRWSGARARPRSSGPSTTRCRGAWSTSSFGCSASADGSLFRVGFPRAGWPRDCASLSPTRSLKFRALTGLKRKGEALQGCAEARRRKPDAALEVCLYS